MSTIPFAPLALFFLATAQAAEPADVKYRDDQKPGTHEQVERGRILYGACSGCHGLSGEGLVGMAPRINGPNYLSIVSNEFLIKAARDGRRATPMIAWGKALPEEDLQALVAYIRAWQTEDGLELDESPLKGNLKNGQKIFEERCSSCHGDNGFGYAQDGQGIAIGRHDFLDAASDGMLRAIIKKGKLGTPMEGLEHDPELPQWTLDDKEIDSVILFLRTEAKKHPK